MASAAYVHLAIVYLLWGTVYPVIRAILTNNDTITPFQLQGSRLLLASLLLLPFVLRSFHFRMGMRDFLICAACGLLFWVGGNGLATYALRELPAAFVAISMAGIPLWTALLQLSLERGAVPARQVKYLAFGFAGMAIVYVPLLGQSQRSYLDAPLALIASLAAPASWAIGSLLQRRISPVVAPEAAAGMQLLLGGAACLILAILDGAPPPRQISLLQGALFVYLAVVAGAICFNSYIKVSRAFPPHIGATFAYVNPVVGILISISLLGERVEALSLLGMAIVIASVAALLWNSRDRSGPIRKP